MRRRRRLRKVLFWGFTFVASVVAGAVLFAYTYITDSNTLAELIREGAPKYLPTSVVRVDRVQLKPLIGDVELKHTAVWQKFDGKMVETLTIPWLQIRSDFRSLLWGKLATREVVVAQPYLRLRRGAGGAWNLQGLLADPWPKAAMIRPVITISKGTIALDDGPASGPILRDVSLKIEPQPDGSYRFEGDARGDVFERMALAGTLDPATGRLAFTKGVVTGLAISDALENRLPPSWREAMAAAGLRRGELDLVVKRLARDPKAARELDYEVDLTLRKGEWNCPKMPFPLASVSGSATVTPDLIRIHHAGGYDGKTVARLGPSWLSAADPAFGPMDLAVEVEHLELDERLKAKTPPEFLKLWDEYAPEGRKNLGQVDASVRATRALAGAKVAYALDVDVLDVAITFVHFQYPLEHIRGTLRLRDETIAVNLATMVGGSPLTGEGTIEHPGPEAVVRLAFRADSVPINETLMDALPPDARKVVREFEPKGSVRGKVDFRRDPLPGDERGDVAVHAELDLNDGDENCSIRWKDLPYPISHLTGHLSLHPDRWVFSKMRGENNLASIEASGEVIQVAKDVLAVDVALSARGLRFDDQLRDSLPPAWGQSWSILNPQGSTDVDAHIVLKPGRPEDYKIRLRPGADASVSLKLRPAPGTETAGGVKVIEIPAMEKVRGTFAYDNGVVAMDDVDFTFRQAPVHFARGRVTLEDSGAFSLGVEDLRVRGLRLEHELRKIMPPVMESFARKLDEGKTYAAGANMNIAWSGRPADAAVCSFDHAWVVFNNNAIAAGLPLEHIQGEIRDIAGRFDGRSLKVDGLLNLASVKVGAMHLTNLTSPLSLADGVARMGDIRASLLGGSLRGAVEVGLDATPNYEATFEVVGAKLEDYAGTVPGHQDYKGDVNGNVRLRGLGQDLKAMSGVGEVHVTDADLGKLPIYLELIQPLDLSRGRRTVFDAADAKFRIEGGQAMLDAIKFTSDAVSLQGSGTVGHLGTMDLRFMPGLGRDEKKLLGLAAAVRELSGQLLVIHVRGSVNAPKIQATPLPVVTRNAGEMLRKLGERREAKTERR